ncbi:HNH endonuclease [Paraburkholderia graminis]|uniref:HNH endonuclease n=1 Tax=Paraburkholderia graminis TaxID=60548 RepID=UPI0038BDED02
MAYYKEYVLTCNIHPEWQPDGLEWRCPYCDVPARSKALTPKQKARVAAAGNAVRIDDLSGGAWAVIRTRIRKRDSYRCRCCSVAVRTGLVDHIKPLAQGGSNHDDNLQLLCHDCHVDKTNRDNGFKVKRKINANGEPEGWF